MPYIIRALCVDSPGGTQRRIIILRDADTNKCYRLVYPNNRNWKKTPLRNWTAHEMEVTPEDVTMTPPVEEALE